jgi:hypothetical protein
MLGWRWGEAISPGIRVVVCACGLFARLTLTVHTGILPRYSFPLFFPAPSLFNFPFSLLGGHEPHVSRTLPPGGHLGFTESRADLCALHWSFSYQGGGRRGRVWVRQILRLIAEVNWDCFYSIFLHPPPPPQKGGECC